MVSFIGRLSAAQRELAGPARPRHKGEVETGAGAGRRSGRSALVGIVLFALGIVLFALGALFALGGVGAEGPIVPFGGALVVGQVHLLLFRESRGLVG